MRIELGSLGIIEGWQKKALECYVDSRLFEQRRDFDEYTVSATNVDANVDLKDLMLLAESFSIKVGTDEIYISDIE